MYEKIEEILCRPLSGFEYTKLEELKQTYPEDKIVKAYKNSPVKNTNYIIKVLENDKSIEPNWFTEELTLNKMDFEAFKEYIEDWYEVIGDKENWIEWVRKQCLEQGTTKEENLIIKEIIEKER